MHKNQEDWEMTENLGEQSLISVSDFNVLIQPQFTQLRIQP